MVFCLFALPLRAGELIKVVGPNLAWPGFTKVRLDMMMPYAETLETRDPNFETDGHIKFTGIRIKTLLNIANVQAPDGVTVIGTDQYVGFIPARLLSQGLVAWQMNKQPISGLKGGPLKIIFPESAGIHLSCYTWYVDALVAGNTDNAVLSVIRNDETKHYSRADMLVHAVELDPLFFSIAQGCRNEFEGQFCGTNARAVPLSFFLKNYKKSNNTPQGDEPLGHIRLEPFAGQAVTVPSKVLNYPIFIVVGCGGHPLHPAVGGPFSVVFPLERHPELSGMVPESGALFFLEKIVVKL